ncbi:uncharacterized protein LOC126264379 isoform X2 [Aethina tumida]|uniref:uncharacterized protein LOC126264379 isoform X2 n=1 Tax=Aethina tumida TaxID=116153 RepID=UPI0021475D5F|nr:uncharacterized protein LOC126264379 isoform X2 [Aethina tumida]
MCGNSSATRGPLLTKRYGLAADRCTLAGPHRAHGAAIASGGARPTAGGRRPVDAEPCRTFPDGRSRWWCAQNSVRMARVATRRPYPNQQLVAQQNGQRHQKATRQCGSLYNAGSADRFGDRGDRLLALRQLLVAGTGGPNRDGGLTQTETASRLGGAHQRGQRFPQLLPIVRQSGKRLAFG